MENLKEDQKIDTIDDLNAFLRVKVYELDSMEYGLTVFESDGQLFLDIDSSRLSLECLLFLTNTLKKYHMGILYYNAV